MNINKGRHWAFMGENLRLMPVSQVTKGKREKIQFISDLCEVQVNKWQDSTELGALEDSCLVRFLLTNRPGFLLLSYLLICYDNDGVQGIKHLSRRYLSLAT